MLRIIDNQASYEFTAGTVQFGEMTTTMTGRRELQPTGEFWQAWNANKAQLKSAGFYCQKSEGKWRVFLSAENSALIQDTDAIDPAMLDEVRVPRYRIRTSVHQALDVRYEEVRGASCTVGRRPFSDDERAKRNRHLKLQISMLRRNTRSGITLEAQDEVPKTASDTVAAMELPMRARRYVIRCRGVQIYESPRIQDAIQQYEQLAIGYQD